MENLSENDISIQPLLKEIGGTIYAIYLQSLYYLAPDVFESVRNIETFMQKYNVQRFDFIEMDTPENFEKGKYEYHVVPFDSMMRCLEEMNKHPNINITVNKG